MTPQLRQMRCAIAARRTTAMHDNGNNATAITALLAKCRGRSRASQRPVGRFAEHQRRATKKTDSRRIPVRGVLRDPDKKSLADSGRGKGRREGWVAGLCQGPLGETGICWRLALAVLQRSAEVGARGAPTRVTKPAAAAVARAKRLESFAGATNATNPRVRFFPVVCTRWRVPSAPTAPKVCV